MRRLIGCLTAVLMFTLVGAIVEAMTVQPVVVDMRMAGREMSAPVRVENNGPNPLPVELRVNEMDFLPDGVRASDRLSDDLMVFPPQAIIPPGETQVFRLQYIGDPDADRSRHYYVTVAQLPVELPEGQSAIQILYNFQVMANVASVVAGAPELSVESSGVTQNAQEQPIPTFTIRNTARNYGYLSASRLTVVQRDAAGQEIFRRTLNPNDIQQQIGFGLVGPETSRNFTAPLELPSADGAVEVTLSTVGRGR